MRRDLRVVIAISATFRVRIDVDGAVGKEKLALALHDI